MINYIIQSTACLLLFLAVYKLVYEKEKMFPFNRIFLLSALFASFMIPLLEFSSSRIVEPIPFSVITSPVEPIHLDVQSSEGINQKRPSNNLFSQQYLIGIYILGVVILTLRFFKNLFHIYGISGRSSYVTYEKAKLILIPQPILPFTFASMIFVSKDDYQKGLLEPEILAHELAHVRQCHSIDLVLAELLVIIFWFNPLLKMYKKAIQINHEFLADESVNRQYGNIPAYQNLLLEKCGLKINPSLTNHFKHSITKLRLIMMYKQTSPITAAIKKLAFVPVLIIMAITFSSRSVAQHEKIPEENINEIRSTLTEPAQEMDPVKAYHALIDKARMENKKSIDARKLDKNKLRELYDQMTEEQRKTAPFAFLLSYGLPEKKSPTLEQLNGWNLKCLGSG